jgi:hypothetical protein
VTDRDNGLPEVETRFWKSKDGRKIAIRDLKDSHLMNIIKMLKKAGMDEARSTYSTYWRDEGPRGEMAQEAFQDEADHQLMKVSVIALALVPLYEALLAEAEGRRKLWEEGPLL